MMIWYMKTFAGKEYIDGYTGEVKREADRFMSGAG